MPPITNNLLKMNNTAQFENFTDINEELRLQSIQQKNQALLNKLTLLKNEALDVTQQIYTAEWNITRSEFVLFVEREEIKQERERLDELGSVVQAAEEKSVAVEREVLALRRQKQALLTEKQQAESRIQDLIQVLQRNNAKILELIQANKIARNRNAAIFLKLKRELEGFERQIERYSGALAAIPRRSTKMD